MVRTRMDFPALRGAARAACVGAFALLGLNSAGSAIAQPGFPSKPITVVVGFEPGGSIDTVARVVAQHLGAPSVVENRTGAGGDIAVDYVARAVPDGYTVVLANVGSVAVNPHLLKVPYDALADLAPITKAVAFPNVIVKRPNMPAKTIADFVGIAKARPGTVTYGTPGIGSAAHLAGALLEMETNVKLVHVPYKGGAPAMRALLAGEIDAYVAAPITVAAHIKSGQAIPLAVTGPKRIPSLRDVPTLAESGYPGYEVVNWYAYYAPAKTPNEIVETLNRLLVKALKAPEVVALFEKLGVEPDPGTPAELASYTRREYEKWGEVVKSAGIQAH